MRTHLLRLTLLALLSLPSSASANGDDDDSAVCDDDDSADTLPEDAGTYGWLCDAAPGGVPAPLALAALGMGLLALRRR